MQIDTNTIHKNKKMSDKVEQVSMAIYMVTNHLSDREPLKTKMRTIGHDLVEYVYINLCQDMTIVFNQFTVIQSLLRIAQQAKMISEQNARLIDIEIRSIKDMIGSSQNGDSVSNALNQLFGSLETPTEGTTFERPSLDSQLNTPKTQIQSFFSQPTTNKVLPAKTKTITPLAQKKESKSGELNNRQENILREITHKGQLTIRDLADKISGCSEKTIQRDLLALVDQGVLKKEGERRWSKYSLASS